MLDLVNYYYVFALLILDLWFPFSHLGVHPLLDLSSSFLGFLLKFFLCIDDLGSAGVRDLLDLVRAVFFISATLALSRTTLSCDLCSSVL